jgi:hypothetical protein
MLSRAGIGQKASIAQGHHVYSLWSRDFCSSGLVWHADTELCYPDAALNLPVRCDALKTNLYTLHAFCRSPLSRLGFHKKKRKEKERKRNLGYL